MTVERKHTGDPARGQFDWNTLCQLLNAEEYEQVTNLLLDAQATSEQRQNELLTNILTAAYYLCVACEECQTEIAWHKQACAEAGRRSQKLNQLLYAIFDQFRERGVPELLKGQPHALTAPTTKLQQAERGTESFSASASLWQRIQSLLGWRPEFRLPDQTMPPILPQTLSSPYSETDESGPPQLIVYCLGPFQVFQDDQLIANWPSGKGKSIFKYLITRRQRPAAKEVLMELFWPDAHPDAARNNLNVAIYGLRQALHDIRPDFSHILFQDDSYLLNPALRFWVDVEVFRDHLKTAQSLERRQDLASAVREYRAAEALYQGEFLAEDRYEDWLIPLRQGLQVDYLNSLDWLSRYYLDQQGYNSCITMCDKILAVDPCQEEAHRRLMRCYTQRGQRYLALRQYQLCVETLQKELDVPPAPGTTALYEQIRQGRAI